MSWVLAIALALAAFALAAFVFGLARGLWTSLLAALAFGLAGYAMQASPGLPAAPKAAQEAGAGADFDIVEARREFVGIRERSGSDTMFMADAMARRGRYADASTFLAGITRENPQDFEAWLAQGNALVEHAQGALTPAALYAFRRSAALRPESIAPGYFIGVSLIRQGRVMEAVAMWEQTLADAPEDAEGRAGLALRLARLEELLAAMNGGPPQAAPPATPPSPPPAAPVGTVPQADSR